MLYKDLIDYIYIQHNISISYDLDQTNDPNFLYVKCDDSLQSFSTIEHIIESFSVIIPELELRDILFKYMDLLKQVLPKYQKEKDFFMNDSSEGGRVTEEAVRRISRESIKLSRLIDELAQCILDLWYSKQCFIILIGINMCDRSSLKVLSRFINLSKRSINLKMILINVEHIEEYNIDFSEKTQYSRTVLFQNFIQNNHVRLDSSIDTNFWRISPKIKNTNYTYNSLIENLVWQNYEVCYDIASQILSRQETSNNQKSKIYRIVSVLDCILGNIDGALELIEISCSYAETVPYAMRSHYTKGLIQVKRKYFIAEALETFEKGIHLFDGSEEAILEKAWMINGISLCKSLLIKNLTYEKKQAKLEEIFLQEFSAFKMLEKAKINQSLIYLRFNLFNNMTFLLEMTGDILKAADFWEAVWFKLRKDNKQAIEFEVAYLYRLAFLKWKGNELENAKKIALSCLKKARHHHDYTRSKILYLLMAIYKDENNIKISSKILLKIISIHWLSKNFDDLGQTVLSLMSVTKDISKSEKKIYQTILEFCDMKDNAITFVSPSPKLPSYIPYIDLEIIPKRDLNRELSNSYRR